MLVDVTWPQGGERYGLPVNTRYGLPVNTRFVWGEDMQLACVPIEHVEVPDEIEPQQFKEMLLRSHLSEESVGRRTAFFNAIARWWGDVLRLKRNSCLQIQPV